MSSDPASLLQKQVKIHSVSAKPELNNKIGVAQSFLPDRNRYLVSLPPHISPSPIALKADNLAIPSFPDKARGKFDEVWGMFLTVYHDDNLRAVLRRGVTTVESQLPPNVKVQHLVIGVLVLLLGLIYFIGLSKTIMIISLLVMGCVVVLPDIVAKRDIKSMAKNFPFRWKEAIEQNMGYRPSQKIATGILVGILVLSSKVLLTPRPRPLAKASMSTNEKASGVSRNTGASFTMAEIYKIGFDDAQNNKVFGESLPDDHVSMTFKSSSYNFDYEDIDYDSYIPAPAPKKSKFGIGTIMALMAVGRTVMDLGFVGGRFEPNLLVANAKNLPPMKLAFMGFMVYRVISAFL
jgi:hypothetical protein